MIAAHELIPAYELILCFKTGCVVLFDPFGILFKMTMVNPSAILNTDSK